MPEENFIISNILEKNNNQKFKKIFVIDEMIGRNKQKLSQEEIRIQ